MAGDLENQADNHDVEVGFGFGFGFGFIVCFGCSSFGGRRFHFAKYVQQMKRSRVSLERLLLSVAVMLYMVVVRCQSGN